MNLKLGSLFDGSGGFPLAGVLFGIEPVWASEIEPYPIAVTKSRFPSMKHLGDISKIHGGEIEPVDIITFGSPCQDLSVAGKRAGLKHADNGDEEPTRSGLFMEAVRIIKEMRRSTNGEYPKLCLWENVPGAFSSNNGEDFKVVLEELVKIVEPSAIVPEIPKAGWAYADFYCGDGWSLAYRLLDAQYWVVPQRRRRIHLVLDLRGERAGKILFERESLQGHFAQGGTPWQAAPSDAQGSSGADDREGEGFDGYNATLTGDKSATLGVNCGVSTGRNGVIERHAVVYSKTHRAQNESDYESWKESVKANTLNTFDMTHVRTSEAVVYAVDQGGGKSSANVTENKAPTLCTTHGGEPAVAYEQPPHYIVRRLTPTECARLQGFPDEWGCPDKKDDFTEEELRFWHDVRNTYEAINGRRVGTYSKKQMLVWHNKLHTDSSEYKMWGNGIALPTALYCMEGMAEALMDGGDSE